MTEKGIYLQIIEQCGECTGIACNECPFDGSKGCSINYETNAKCVRICEQALRDITVKENEIPELVGKRMLVWSKDHMGEPVERIVYGRLPDGYLITAEREYDENGYTVVSYDTFDRANPLPEKIEIEEMTLEAVCNELGREIKIKKG